MTVHFTGALVMLLALVVAGLLLALPFALLGQWEEARSSTAPVAAVLLGWALRGVHDEARRRQRGRA